MATRITLIYADGSHVSWAQDGAPSKDDLERWRGQQVLRVLVDMAI